MTQDEKFIKEIELSLLAYKIIVMDNDMELAKEVEEEINWLKSLKDRVLPQNIVYYNPYKATIESIAEMCKRYDVASHSGLRDFYDNVKVKCKEAIEYDKKYPQKQWKPTQEQIKHLAAAVEGSGGNFVLDSLYEQLKQLYYDTNRKNQEMVEESETRKSRQRFG